VTLRVQEVDTAYSLADRAAIVIDGQAAMVADLATLRSRPRVKVTFTRDEAGILALVAEGETVTGSLRKVNVGQNTVTVVRTATDAKATPATWPLAPNAAVTLDGTPATLTDLREGITASVLLSADGKRVLALDAKSP
jgi:hypothetical protein